MRPITVWRTTCLGLAQKRKPTRMRRRKRTGIQSRSAPMPNRVAIGLAAAAVLLTGISTPAHHSFGSEFDVSKPLALRGTVTVMEWVNPHSWIHIDVKGPDGTANWMVEGGSPNALLRLGF